MAARKRKDCETYKEYRSNLKEEGEHQQLKERGQLIFISHSGNPMDHSPRRTYSRAEHGEI